MDSTQKAVKNQEICEPLQGNLGITQSSGLDIHVVFSTYVLFSFGKLVIILPCMILIAACVLIIVTLPVAHRKFCRHQVA